MSETNTTIATLIATLDKADEEILTYEVSDEALEDAAGQVRGVIASTSTRECVASHPCCR
jgi:hypothetical protein